MSRRPAPPPPRPAKKQLFLVPTHIPMPLQPNPFPRMGTQPKNEGAIRVATAGTRFGQTSLRLAPKVNGFFEPLYVHPLFGHLGQWGGAERPFTKGRLPPINSAAGTRVAAAERQLVRVSWGRQPFGTGLQPGVGALHFGATLQSRMGPTEATHRYPSSPDRHCVPPPPLPPSPRTARVHSSTHRMLRCPPHTAHQKQLHLAMYGQPPYDDDEDAAAVASVSTSVQGTKQA